jgi:hypothetical protein
MTTLHLINRWSQLRKLSRAGALDGMRSRKVKLESRNLKRSLDIASGWLILFSLGPALSTAMEINGAR